MSACVNGQEWELTCENVAKGGDIVTFNFVVEGTFVFLGEVRININGDNGDSSENEKEEEVEL